MKRKREKKGTPAKRIRLALDPGDDAMDVCAAEPLLPNEAPQNKSDEQTMEQPSLTQLAPGTVGSTVSLNPPRRPDVPEPIQPVALRRCQRLPLPNCSCQEASPVKEVAVVTEDVSSATNTVVEPLEKSLQSESSSDEPCCRFCQSSEISEESGPLISPCCCQGSMRVVHQGCLDAWREHSANPDSLTTCETCQSPYLLEYHGPNLLKQTTFRILAGVLTLWIDFALFLVVGLMYRLGSATLMGRAMDWQISYDVVVVGAQIVGSICGGFVFLHVRLGADPEMGDAAFPVATLHELIMTLTLLFGLCRVFLATYSCVFARVEAALGTPKRTEMYVVLDRGARNEVSSLGS